jgi:hypothetical protein
MLREIRVDILVLFLSFISEYFLFLLTIWLHLLLRLCVCVYQVNKVPFTNKVGNE